MVKATCSFGGKLLFVLVTIVVYTIVLAAGIVGIGYYAYKNVTVRELAGLIHAQDWISEEYDGTLEEFVHNVSDALRGEITLNTIIEISPMAREAFDGIVANAENVGLFKIDTEALYSMPVGQISSQIDEVLVITATLQDLSETFAFSLPALPLIEGTEEAPLYFYAQANALTEAGGYAGLDQVFTLSEEDFSYFTRESAYFSTYTQGDETLPVVQTEERTVVRLEGVGIQGGYLTYGGGFLYLGTAAEGGGTIAYSRMTENSAALWQTPGADGDDYLFALAENQALYTVTAPAESDNGFVYERIEAETAGTAYAAKIAARYRYEPLYALRNGNYVLATQTDGNGNYVIDAENGGYAIAEDYKSEKELYYRTDLYTELSAEEAETTATAQAVYARTNGLAHLPLTKALDTLADALDVNALTLADMERYFGVQVAESGVLEHLLYVPLGRFAEAVNEEIEGLRLNEVLSLSATSPRILLTLAYGKNYAIGEDGSIIAGDHPTIGSLAESVDALTIADIIDIREPDAETGETGSPKLLLAVKDWTLHDFADSEKINALSLGDLIEIGDGAPHLLAALKDVAVGNLADAIDGIPLGDMLDISPSDPLLGALSSSTLRTLADDIANLSVQELFADSIYVQEQAGTLADLDALAQAYGADNLYILQNGSYIGCDSLSEETLAAMDGDTAVYSPYKRVSDAGAYAGTPLYYFQTGENGGQMALATGVTAWDLPETLPNGVTRDTAFYLQSGGGYIAAVRGDKGYSSDAVWYLDRASEQMKRLNLVPTAYGVLDAFAGETLFAKLTPAETTAEGYYTVGNLFAFDIENERWRQVQTQAVRAGDGSIAYKLAEDEEADGALYTYGQIAGAWKYLLLRGGAEQACTLQNIDELVANVASNLRTATIGALYEDGMIDIAPPEGTDAEEVLAQPVQTENGQKTLGELTIGEMIAAVYAIISKG